MAKPDIAVYEFGSFRLYPTERRLLRDGQTVFLTPRLLDILLVLVRNSGQIVTKEILMKEVWRGVFVEDNNLTVSMSALRKALGERHREHEYIETVTKRGYRFVARVREVGNVETDARSSIMAGGRAPAVELERNQRALAVLPLLNVSEDPDMQYLSEGITESIINSLSRLPQLRVMARSTVFHYEGRTLDARQIGQELNVQSVVAGTLRQLNDHLTLAVELVDVSDGSQIWGEQYERQISDLLTVQQEISREISEKLRIKLTGEERERLARRYTEDPEAYHLYLKGRYFWNKRTVRSINRGIRYFEKAIALDESFALAYAGLADCYISLVIWNAQPAEASLRRARRAVIKALSLDIGLAEAHASLAFIEMLSLNWPEVEREFRRAIELNPNSALSRSRYTIYLTVYGRREEAIAQIEQALRTDPLSPLLHTNSARMFFFAEEYERAIESCREALEIEPDFGAAYGVLGLVYERLGRYEEAILVMQRAVNLMEGDAEALAILGYLYAATGLRREAETALDKLHKLAERQYVPTFFMAFIHIGLKQKEEAFKWLEKSYEERSYVLIFLNALPIFDYLRDDPRFTDLLRRIGLSEVG